MNNVLIVVPNDSLGGAEQFLKMVSDHFLKEDYTVYVFFFKKKATGAWEKIEANDNLKLFYTKSVSEKFGIFGLLANLLNNRYLRFEYAFSSHVHCTALVGLLRRFSVLKIKHFVGRESTSIFVRFSGFKLLLFKIQYRIGYPVLDLLICQTTYMRDQLLASLPWMDKKVKIKVLSNPVDLVKINELSMYYEDTQHLLPFIVSAGRLIPEKGFDTLIQAFSMLSTPLHNIKLIILGEGRMLEELMALVKKLGLQGRVCFLGFRPNVLPYFKVAKMCVVPSRIEGFPNVLLQMMSQNEKVVSTLCAGGVEDLKGVYTCAPANVDELAQTIKKCLHSNTSENRTFFNIELEGRSIEKFIREVKSCLGDKL